MGTQDFDRVIERLPAIAKIVNDFQAELQRHVFDLLISRLGLNPGRSSVARSSRSQSTVEPDARELSKGKRRRRGLGAQPKVLSTLNLRAPGKKSLRDFASEKKPKDNQERLVVIAYYLKEILGKPSFNRDHMYMAFKEIGVKVPTNIDVAMRVTASRKAWLDTADMNAVTLTIPGANFVEHDLPSKMKEG